MLRRVRYRALTSLLVATCVLSLSGVARAEPEWASAFLLGAAGIGRNAVWERTRFYGALHGDALLLRDSYHAIGVGPALDVGTTGFSDVRVSGSAMVLLPLGEFLAVSLAPGASVRSSSSGAVAGVTGRAFFGVRAYGYTDYALNGGLVLGLDQDVGGPKEHAIVIAAQIDGLVLALPVVLLVSWIRGSHE